MTNTMLSRSVILDERVLTKLNAVVVFHSGHNIGQHYILSMLEAVASINLFPVVAMLQYRPAKMHQD